MLLTTKLFIPRRLPQLVARPHLLEKLQAATASNLLLISAPAGFGKTTLITEWIASFHSSDNVTNPPSTIHHPHFCWLSLDENDNDPMRFIAYLVAALQRVDATLGNGVQALLTSPQPPALEMLMTLLLNEISQSSQSFALVLDDFHTINTRAIHEAVTFLVEQMPPPMRLVITSRVDPPLPLARWRVRRLMIEIRQRDLRFDTAETAMFLRHTMALSLMPEEARLLEERTEGVAGLQMAALSLQSQTDASNFIQRFCGNNSYVVDYLMEEVWQHQPEAVQTFLLQTAILDRLTASLCDAVTGHKDGQAMLEYLQRANLFLIPLDDERKWYRYHHLFAEMLRERGIASLGCFRPIRCGCAKWWSWKGLPTNFCNV